MYHFENSNEELQL